MPSQTLHATKRPRWRTTLWVASVFIPILCIQQFFFNHALRYKLLDWIDDTFGNRHRAVAATSPSALAWTEMSKARRLPGEGDAAQLTDVQLAAVALSCGQSPTQALASLPSGCETFPVTYSARLGGAVHSFKRRYGSPITISDRIRHPVVENWRIYFGSDSRARFVEYSRFELHGEAVLLYYDLCTGNKLKSPPF